MPLAKERNTPMRDPSINAFPVAAAVKIFQGSLVALSAAGLATPGATAATLTAAGRAEETVDNTSGAAGAVMVTVRRGVFQFKNLAGDPVVQADVNKPCFIVDDETVAKTNGGATRSQAGIVRGVDTAGVWVEI
jgi:predicted metal-binding membrane protein